MSRQACRQVCRWAGGSQGCSNAGDGEALCAVHQKQHRFPKAWPGTPRSSPPPQPPSSAMFPHHLHRALNSEARHTQRHSWLPPPTTTTPPPHPQTHPLPPATPPPLSPLVQGLEQGLVSRQVRQLPLGHGDVLSTHIRLEVALQRLGRGWGRRLGRGWGRGWRRQAGRQWE